LFDEEHPLTAYDPARYGDVVGDYDKLYPGDPAETEAAVALLAELAQARPPHAVLELGVGTGRVALPLHRLGLRVAGVDGSERMVAQLRAKDDGDQIEVAIGDYRTTRIAGTFSVVALLFNNILDPRGRDAQIDIFRNAASHLEPGGVFVVESMVLSDAQRSGEWAIQPRHVGSEHVELQLARYDITTNRIERTLIHLLPEGLQFVTVADTYASPGELDIMAEIAGFRLLSRFEDWARNTFTAASARHLSVYELVSGPAA
jgi:SAM-dependent methyltransferase